MTRDKVSGFGEVSRALLSASITTVSLRARAFRVSGKNVSSSLCLGHRAEDI
jgi:hypothetical protein